MRFWVLKRDFTAKKPEDQFSISTMEAENIEKAWLEIENEDGNREVQSWILKANEYRFLKGLLGLQHCEHHCDLYDMCDSFTGKKIG